MFYEIALPILTSDEIEETKYFQQHNGTSVYYHCASVAYFSLILANTFRIKCDYSSLIRGALLHDYYLYDWRDKDKSHSWHGFRHPYTACKKADEVFGLNELEKEIIKRHMFPLTPVPPKHIEAYLVSIADKILAMREVAEINVKRIELMKKTLRYKYNVEFMY